MPWYITCVSKVLCRNVRHITYSTCRLNMPVSCVLLTDRMHSWMNGPLQHVRHVPYNTCIQAWPYRGCANRLYILWSNKPFQTIENNLLITRSLNGPVLWLYKRLIKQPWINGPVGHAQYRTRGMNGPATLTYVGVYAGVGQNYPLISVQFLAVYKNAATLNCCNVMLRNSEFWVVRRRRSQTTTLVG